MRRCRVAVTHPRLARGGSEATALWTLTALARDHDVSLLTSVAPDWRRLDRFYGTTLASCPPKVLLPRLPRFALDRSDAVALRHALFERFCRRVAGRFDVLVSSYNMVDFGVPAIHLLADFTWDRSLAERYDPAPAAKTGRLRSLYPLYRRVAEAVAGPARWPMLKPDSGDLVLANSAWTAAQMAELFGLATPVIFPPVDLGGHENARDASAPSARQPFHLVALGRVAPEKRLLDLIAIVAEARQRSGHAFTLAIVGGVGTDAHAQSLRDAAARAGQWVTLEGEQTGADKAAQLARATFGLHGREGEPFGIAIAEMVHAGVLPLVPRDSGSAEIVFEDDLCWSTRAEAVETLTALADDPTRQAALRDRLASSCERFSVATYCADIRRHVADFVGRR